MNNYTILVFPVVIGIIIGIFVTNYNEDPKLELSSENLLTVKKLIKNGSPILGNPSAPITILEWGDYQCTFCYRFHQTSLNTIYEEYIKTGKVNLVFKDFPLNGADSIHAAEASYCAEEQGKYWEFHDQLYVNWGGERTGWITRNSLNVFAEKIELEITEFNSCMNEQRYHQKVLELEQFGREIGIDATPSFLIFNDEKVIKIRGNQPIEVFKRVIEEL